MTARSNFDPKNIGSSGINVKNYHVVNVSSRPDAYREYPNAHRHVPTQTQTNFRRQLRGKLMLNSDLIDHLEPDSLIPRDNVRNIRLPNSNKQAAHNQTIKAP